MLLANLVGVTPDDLRTWLVFKVGAKKVYEDPSDGTGAPWETSTSSASRLGSGGGALEVCRH
jgi:hypothetical protein